MVVSSFGLKEHLDANDEDLSHPQGEGDRGRVVALFDRKHLCRIAQTPGPCGIDGDPCDLIDMLVVDTPAAKTSAGGEAAMKALIHLAVAGTNNGFHISGVTPRVKLVHVAEVRYTESGKHALRRSL